MSWYTVRLFYYGALLEMMWVKARNTVDASIYARRIYGRDADIYVYPANS